jgi:serine/threonine kinase 16
MLSTASLLLKPSIKINDKKYKVVKIIGEGGFAFVYHVKSVCKQNKNCSFALKKMICQTEEQLEEAKNEIDTLTKLNKMNHSHVLKLIDSTFVVNKKGQDEVLLLLPLYVGTVQSVIDKGPGYPRCGFADGRTFFSRTNLIKS